MLEWRLLQYLHVVRYSTKFQIFKCLTRPEPGQYPYYFMLKLIILIKLCRWFSNHNFSLTSSLLGANEVLLKYLRVFIVCFFNPHTKLHRNSKQKLGVYMLTLALRCLYHDLFAFKVQLTDKSLFPLLLTMVPITISFYLK